MIEKQRVKMREVPFDKLASDARALLAKKLFGDLEAVSFQFDPVHELGAGLGQFQGNQCFRAAEVQHCHTPAGASDYLQSRHLPVKIPFAPLDAWNFEPALGRSHGLQISCRGRTSALTAQSRSGTHSSISKNVSMRLRHQFCDSIMRWVLRPSGSCFIAGRVAMFRNASLPVRERMCLKTSSRQAGSMCSNTSVQITRSAIWGLASLPGIARSNSRTSMLGSAAARLPLPQP